MTNSFLARFEALSHARFRRHGLADEAVYRPASGPGIPCGAYVERSAAQTGELGQVTYDATTVEILRSDVPSPARGARIDLATGESLRLDSLQSQDEASTVWVVGTQ